MLFTSEKRDSIWKKDVNKIISILGGSPGDWIAERWNTNASKKMCAYPLLPLLFLFVRFSPFSFFNRATTKKKGKKRKRDGRRVPDKEPAGWHTRMHDPDDVVHQGPPPFHQGKEIHQHLSHRPPVRPPAHPPPRENFCMNSKESMRGFYFLKWKKGEVTHPPRPQVIRWSRFWLMFHEAAAAAGPFLRRSPTRALFLMTFFLLFLFRSWFLFEWTDVCV